MDPFRKHGVISDVIDKEPMHILKVTYGKIDVSPGAVLTPTQVQDVPHLLWPVEEGCHYTVVMTDPDAPSRETPKMREWHHWLVVNIPGCDVASGEVKSQYIGAGPPQHTKLHRYVLLVFKQPEGKMDFSDLPTLKVNPDGRGKKKVREFLVKKYNFTELTAANFFQAEFDDYVPKLYAKFKGN